MLLHSDSAIQSVFESFKCCSVQGSCEPLTCCQLRLECSIRAALHPRLVAKINWRVPEPDGESLDLAFQPCDELHPGGDFDRLPSRPKYRFQQHFACPARSPFSESPDISPKAV